MLYVTTRNSRDVFTANRAMQETRGADGGLFVPFHLPVYSPEEIASLREKSFHACVAQILNQLFHTHLNAWDVEFCVGRYAVRLANLKQRIVVAECWHNPKWQFSCLVSSIMTRIRETQTEPAEGDWMQIGVRIAVLFGIFGELFRADVASMEKKVDVSTVCGDFSGVMSAWYARQMGLPVGNIVVCCNENNTLWDLMTHGQLRTDTVCIRTDTPDTDVTLPVSLERLIYAVGGESAVGEYLSVCRRGGMYVPDPLLHSKLREGLYVSVVSQPRLKTIIPNVFSSNRYVLSSYSALAYGGLMDYRSGTGSMRTALLLADRSPVCEAERISALLGIKSGELDALV